MDKKKAILRFGSHSYDRTQLDTLKKNFNNIEMPRVNEAFIYLPQSIVKNKKLRKKVISPASRQLGPEFVIGFRIPCECGSNILATYSRTAIQDARNDKNILAPCSVCKGGVVILAYQAKKMLELMLEHERKEAACQH